MKPKCLEWYSGLTKGFFYKKAIAWEEVDCAMDAELYSSVLKEGL